MEKQSLFGSQNCNDVVNRVSTEPWEVYLKPIMKQNRLLGVENDEVIVRNGCQKEDLKI